MLQHKKNIPVKHRITSGYIVPYIELPLDKCDVSYAVSGPLQCGDDQKKFQIGIMENMMVTNGYSTLIECSKIPVRY